MVQIWIYKQGTHLGVWNAIFQLKGVVFSKITLKVKLEQWQNTAHTR